MCNYFSPNLISVLSNDPTCFTITVTSDGGDSDESEYSNVKGLQLFWLLLLIVLWLQPMFFTQLNLSPIFWCSWLKPEMYALNIQLNYFSKDKISILYWITQPETSVMITLKLCIRLDFVHSWLINFHLKVKVN